jgi:hypothetical protein
VVLWPCRVQVAQALLALFSKQYVHLDLKWDNVVVKLGATAADPPLAVVRLVVRLQPMASYCLKVGWVRACHRCIGCTCRSCHQCRYRSFLCNQVIDFGLTRMIRGVGMVERVSQDVLRSMQVKKEAIAAGVQ